MLITLARPVLQTRFMKDVLIAAIQLNNQIRAINVKINQTNRALLNFIDISDTLWPLQPHKYGGEAARLSQNYGSGLTIGTLLAENFLQFRISGDSDRHHVLKVLEAGLLPRDGVAPPAAEPY